MMKKKSRVVACSVFEHRAEAKAAVAKLKAAGYTVDVAYGLDPCSDDTAFVEIETKMPGPVPPEQLCNFLAVVNAIIKPFGGDANRAGEVSPDYVYHTIDEWM